MPCGVAWAAGTAIPGIRTPHELFRGANGLVIVCCVDRGIASGIVRAAKERTSVRFSATPNEPAAARGAFDPVREDFRLVVAPLAEGVVAAPQKALARLGVRPHDQAPGAAARADALRAE